MNFQPQTRHGVSIIRIPLIALIDVVLFLLLYFIMAGELAAGREGELNAALQTDKSPRAANLQPQVLRVDGALSGVAYVIGERRVSSVRELSSILVRLPREAGILVRVSGDVSVEAAVGAVQACRDAGFVRVSYVPQNR
jgi:biopolymer transport protein ExbD